MQAWVILDGLNLNQTVLIQVSVVQFAWVSVPVIQTLCWLICEMMMISEPPVRLWGGWNTILYVKHLLSAWHMANILWEPSWLKYRLKSNVKSPLLWATLHQEPVPQGLKMQGFMINMVLTFKTHLEKTSNVLLTWMQGSVSFCPFQRKTQDWMPTAPLSDISRSSGQTALQTTKPHLPTVDRKHKA